MASTSSTMSRSPESRGTAPAPMVQASEAQQRVVDRISAEVQQILSEKETQDKLLNAGAIAHFQPPAQIGQRIQQDYAKWGQVIRDKGIAVE